MVTDGRTYKTIRRTDRANHGAIFHRTRGKKEAIEWVFTWCWLTHAGLCIAPMLDTAMATPHVLLHSVFVYFLWFPQQSAPFSPKQLGCVKQTHFVYCSAQTKVTVQTPRALLIITSRTTYSEVEVQLLFIVILVIDMFIQLSIIHITNL